MKKSFLAPSASKGVKSETCYFMQKSECGPVPFLVMYHFSCHPYLKFYSEIGVCLISLDQAVWSSLCEVKLICISAIVTSGVG